MLSTWLGTKCWTIRRFQIPSGIQKQAYAKYKRGLVYDDLNNIVWRVAGGNIDNSA